MRREGFGQICDASRLNRGRSIRRAVTSRNEDDGQRDTLIRHAPAQIDTRMVLQIDVQNGADRLVKVSVREQRGRRFEQQGAESMLTQQPSHTDPHGRVVIDDENACLAGQCRRLS